MNKQGIGFLVAAVAAVGVGMFVAKNASANGIVRTRKAVRPFQPPKSPDSLRSLPVGGAQDPDVLAMQLELATWFDDDRNIILAPDGVTRVRFPEESVTGVLDLATIVATWIFQTWNNTFMRTDPEGVELDDDGLPNALVLSAIQRYNRS